MELSETQRSLLLVMRRRPLRLTGQESGEEHLAILQLWNAGLVDYVRIRDNSDAMEWRLTEQGRAKALLLR